MSPHQFIRLAFLTAAMALHILFAASSAVAQQKKTEVFGTAALTYRHEAVHPHVQGLVLHHFDKAWGVAGFAQLQPYADFAQMLAGPTLTHKGLTIGLMGGLENSDHDIPLRGSVFLTYVKPRWDVALTGEYGATETAGAWYQALVRMGNEVREGALAPHIGVLSRRFFGEGIYCDLETTDFALSLAIVEGFEDRAADDGSYEDYIRIETALTVKL
jgi:hypothetical protein